MHLPDLDEGDEAEPGSPVFWCAAVGFAFDSGDQELLDALAKPLLDQAEEEW